MSLSVLSTGKEPALTIEQLVGTNTNTINGDSKFFNNLDKNLFTFKPKLNPKSNMIAQNFSSFLERQSLHSTKRLELVKFINLFYGFIYKLMYYLLQLNEYNLFLINDFDSNHKFYLHVL
jgi:hypothetical protein